MAAADVQRQLLLALLAFQNNFLNRADLVAAFAVWQQDQSQPLPQLLVARKHLSPEQLQLLEALAEHFLARFGNDVEQSFAHLSGIASSVRGELQTIAHSDLQASLAAVGREPKPLATVADSVGEATSAGARFRILRPHARGGLGEVHVAQDTELPREVALKQIQAEYADDEASRARFLQEAEITGALEHPSIVPVYGLGTYADGRPFYAMRFIRGDSLKEAIARFHDPNRKLDAGERSVEFRKLLQRFIDVCNAIGYAHSRGILHRDLKPGNIMLGKYGETLVVDWGLAKSIKKAGEPGASATGAANDEQTLIPHSGSGSGSAETRYGTAIGTPAYMSPEQAAGRLDELGPQSDVYSLGATLYEILTGKRSQSGGDLGEVLQRVANGDFSTPGAVRAGVPKSLEAVCLRAMSLRPADRYGTARQLANEIEHWLADEPIFAMRDPLMQRVGRWARKHRTFVSSGAVLLMTTAVALAVSLVLVSEEQHKTTVQREHAEAQRAVAERERSESIKQRDLADAERNRALKKQRESTALRLAAEARIVREQFPQRSLLLGLEAARSTMSHEEPLIPLVRQGLIDSLSGIGGRTVARCEQRYACGGFTKNGRWLCTVTGPSEIVLWDLRQDVHRQRPKILAFDDSVIVDVVLDDATSIFYVATADGTIRAWELASSDPVPLFQQLLGKPNDSALMATSADGTRLAILWSDRTTDVWKIERVSNSWKATKERGLSLAVPFPRDSQSTRHNLLLSPDGRWLLIWKESGFSDKKLSIDWNLRKVGRPNSVHHLLINNCILFDLNASSPIDRVFRLETLDGSMKHESIAHAAFSPDSKALAVSYNGHMALLRLTESSAHVYSQAKTKFAHFAFSPGGRWLAGGGDSSVLVVDMQSEDPLSNTRKFRASEHSFGDVVDRICWSPDDRWLTVAMDEWVRKWDMNVTDPTQSAQDISGHSGHITALVCDRGTQYFISSSSDHTSRLWLIDERNPNLFVRILHGHEAPIDASSLSDSGRWLLTWSRDGEYRLWDLKYVRSGCRRNHVANDVKRAFFVGDGSFLVTTGEELGVWRPLEGGRIASIFTLATSEEKSGEWDAAADKAGNCLVVWNRKALLVYEDFGALIENRGWSKPKVIRWPTEGAYRVSISDNGRWLAALTSSDEKQIYLGLLSEIVAGGAMKKLAGHEKRVETASFSPDGQWLITRDFSSRARLWNLRAEDPATSGVVLAAGDGFYKRTFLSADGRWLVFGSGNAQKYATLYDLMANDVSGTKKTVDGDFVEEVRFLESEQRLLTLESSRLALRALDGSSSEPIGVWTEDRKE